MCDNLELYWNTYGGNKGCSEFADSALEDLRLQKNFFIEDWAKNFPEYVLHIDEKLEEQNVNEKEKDLEALHLKIHHPHDFKLVDCVSNLLSAVCNPKQKALADLKLIIPTKIVRAKEKLEVFTKRKKRKKRKKKS